MIGDTSVTFQPPSSLANATRSASTATLAGLPASVCVPRINTATLAAEDPSASSPAEIVRAPAVTLRLVKSVAVESNWALNASA